MTEHLAAGGAAGEHPPTGVSPQDVVANTSQSTGDTTQAEAVIPGMATQDEAMREIEVDVEDGDSALGEINTS